MVKSENLGGVLIILEFPIPCSFGSWDLLVYEDQSLQVRNEVPKLRLCDGNCLELLCPMVAFHYEITNKKV